mmetsp:Transcript_19272/g.41419  ORF Transcript_19272/g.41419 Transcript_19272/m.41419 type:complete len:795 (-) Transcript_19272:102-2486(-)
MNHWIFATTTAALLLSYHSFEADALLTQGPGNTVLKIGLHNTQLKSTPVDNDFAEDLDDALEHLLGDVVRHVDGTPPPPARSTRPLQEAASLFENDATIDFNDPAVLSTTNPRWVEAGLDQKVIDVLSGKGITTFTPVQGEAFEPVLKGRDVIGRSRTGTGKTLAFGLPSLTRLVDITMKKGTRDEMGRMKRGRGVSMVVLCPTRELARQVSEELMSVARPLGFFVEVFHGGVSYDPQARALRNGVDVLVGTPGRVIDHMDRGNLDLSECNIAVLDEADEMLNMGFAEDVEVILEDVGVANAERTQALLFSATTPSWVKQIGAKYQRNVFAVDATSDQGGARVATTVRHLAVQLPPGVDSKRSILEDIIAVEISKDTDNKKPEVDENNAIAVAAAEKKKKSSGAMQQKIFGKTIVFTETKREADDLVSGGVFKSLTAQALHGDVGQKQRDATLNAFRAGAFNVLVATDVAARGIDIQDVDLVIQFDPPRDVDTYVHRSGRTGRAGNKGTSVLMFNPQQARDIVRIERDLGHGFKFDLVGPPSTESALKAAAKTSSIASSLVPDETAAYFKEAAAELLEECENPEDVVARCLAAISRRAADVQSRSLLTGELGFATVEMTNSQGRNVGPGDVMYTVSKLSRMSQKTGDLVFDSDVGKIKVNTDSGSAVFDMGVLDAKRLVEFSQDIDAGGAEFKLLQELEIERGRHFGKPIRTNGRFNNRKGGPRGPQRGGRQGGWNNRGSNGNNRSRGYSNNRNYHGQNHRSDHENRRGNNNGYRGRYESQGQGRRDHNPNESW